eukprot:2131613-Pyramimonas_sp.AAC.1
MFCMRINAKCANLGPRCADVPESRCLGLFGQRKKPVCLGCSSGCDLCNLDFPCPTCTVPASHNGAVPRANERREAEEGGRPDMEARGRDLAEMREELRESEIRQQEVAAHQLERGRGAMANAARALEERQQASAAAKMGELANRLENT